MVNVCQGQDPGRIDNIAQYYAGQHQFMGSVLVARGDEVLFKKGYGLANAEWNIANDPQTRFRIASLTKQFTAAAILLLEERGKLKVSDPIGQYLENAAPLWQKITIFQLLTHTSGIPDFTDDPECQVLDMSVSTPELLTERFRKKPLDFNPGTQWAYSNSGYVLLGRIVERVTGEKLAEFLDHNIFKPLGMVATGQDSNTEVVLRRATGHVRTSTALKHARFMELSNRYAAGDLCSTTEDLMRWQLGLFSGRVLAGASLEKMIAPAMNNYAMGLFVINNGNNKLISHSGGIAGFNTYILIAVGLHAYVTSAVLLVGIRQPGAGGPMTLLLLFPVLSGILLWLISKPVARAIISGLE